MSSLTVNSLLEERSSRRGLAARVRRLLGIEDDEPAGVGVGAGHGWFLLLREAVGI